MRLLRAVIFIALCSTSACARNQPPAPTPAAAVADAGTRIQQSANAILHAAETASTTQNPSTGKTLITRDQLDQVAIGVDRIGRTGLLLQAGLRNYAAVKNANGDVSVYRAEILKLVDEATTALNSIGKAIPTGIVQTIDQAVTTIFSLIAQVKAGAVL